MGVSLGLLLLLARYDGTYNGLTMMLNESEENYIEEFDGLPQKTQSLFDAVKMNDLETFKKEFYGQLFFNWTGSTILHLTALFNRLEMATIILTTGFNPNFFDLLDETPLTYAIKFNHSDMVKLLVKYNANIHLRNQKGETPLHLALTYKKVKIIQILKQKKVDLTFEENEAPSSLDYFSATDY